MMDEVFMQKSNAKPANVEIKPAGLPRVTRGRKESSNIIGKFQNIYIYGQYSIGTMPINCDSRFYCVIFYFFYAVYSVSGYKNV